MFKGKSVLITGGQGTWGQEITRQLLKKGVHKVVIFSRGEASQVAMKQSFRDKRIKFVIGDTRDARAIMGACRGINYVFHTAALKHVSKCEMQPQEAVKTNIDGVRNVIEACIKNSVDICVNISTDKVCRSTCTYGHTKAIAEALFTEANNQTMHTDFFSVRCGNIFASAGSVIPIWKSMIKDCNILSVTDPDMTRFFVTIKDAVKLTLKAFENSDRGEVFVPVLKAWSISELCDTMIKRQGNNKTQINVIGALPGERTVEWLFTQEESQRLTRTKDFFIIYPTIDIDSSQYPPPETILKYSHGYCSVENMGTLKQLENMFHSAGY